MDVETADALEALRGDVRAMEQRLEGKMDQMGADLRGEFARTADGLRTDLRAEIAQTSESLRIDLRAEISQSRVHAKVLTEIVQDDIRLVAEAVAVLTQKVDAL